MYEDFLQAKHEAEAASAYARHSGRFPLCGVGDVNLYAVFAEHFLNQINPQGRAGFIVPTGIATDDSTKAYFEAIATGSRLVSLYDFENREKIFAAVDSRMKFVLVTLGHRITQAQFVFFATRAEQLYDSRRQFTLSADDITLLNPNTRTCPVFRSQQDAELTKKIYRNAPILIREDDEKNSNPWGIRFSRLFDMSNDSYLFRTYAQQKTGDVPLFESKMAHQFDHRWACYETDGESARDVTLAEKQDPNFTVRPRYWIAEWEVTQRITPMYKGIFAAINSRAVSEKLANESLCKALAEWLIGHIQAKERIGEAQQWFKRISHIGLVAAVGQCQKSDWVRSAKNYIDTPLSESEFEQLLSASDLWGLVDDWIKTRRPRWSLGWRDICRNTDYRTLMSAVVPTNGVDGGYPLIITSTSPALSACLLGNLNCLTADSVSRQKVSGAHLKYFHIRQIPILSPSAYISADLDYIVPRVLELTYTAYDLTPFAEDLGFYGEPFKFDPDRRAILRAELDAYYATLYGLSRDELRYILDPADVMGADYPSETFRVLKNNDIKAYGEYRTGRLVLEAWDRLHQSSHLFSDQSHIRNHEEAQLAGLLLFGIKLQPRLSLGQIEAIYQMVKNPGFAELFLGKSAYQELVALSKQYASVIEATTQTNTTNLLSGLEHEKLITISLQQGEAFYQAAQLACPNYWGITIELERFTTLIIAAIATQENRKQQMNSISDGKNKQPLHKAQ